MSIKELKKMKKQLSVFKVEDDDNRISKETIDETIKNMSIEAREDVLNNFIDGKLLYDRLEVETLKELLKANE